MFPDDLCSYNSYYIYKRRWQVQREFPIFAMHLNSAELKLVCRRHRRTRAARRQNDPGGSHASENCRRSLSFPGECKKIRAIFEGGQPAGTGGRRLAGGVGRGQGGNNFKPLPLILRFRVASAHLTSEKSFSRKKNSASAPQRRRS